MNNTTRIIGLTTLIILFISLAASTNLVITQVDYKEGNVSIGEVTQKNGSMPYNTPSSEADYRLELISFNEKILEQSNFSFQTEAVLDGPDRSTVLELNETSHTIVMADSEKASKIVLKNASDNSKIDQYTLRDRESSQNDLVVISLMLVLAALSAATVYVFKKRKEKHSYP